MSDISPTSFVDDGSNIGKRLTIGTAWAITKRTGQVDDDESTIASTWSYVDDGADLLSPAADEAGIGKMNAKYYEQPLRKIHSKSIHPGLRHAVSGDIHNTLAKVKAISRFKVKQAKQSLQVSSLEDQLVQKSAIRISMPSALPAFVIKGPDGRVIVVDKDGDVIDSGPLSPPAYPLPNRKQTRTSATVRDGAGDEGGNKNITAQQGPKQIQEQKQKLEGPLSAPNKKGSIRKTKQGPPTKTVSSAASDFAMSGGLGFFSSSSSSEDSWQNDLAHDAASNYQAATI